MIADYDPPVRIRTLERLTRVLAALTLLLAAATPVAGQVTVPALSDPVTDSADVLSDEAERELEVRLAELHDSTGVQLWAVYIDSLNGFTAPDLADNTATSNSLGADDALLLVAFTDRAYALWVSDGIEGVTDDEIDRILADRVEPELANDDPAAATIAAAEGLGEAVGAVVPTAPPVTTAPSGSIAPPGGGSGPGAGGGFGWLPLVGLVLLLGGGFLAFRWLRAQQPGATRSGTATDEGDLATARLRRESTAALVEADEAIRDAETELAAAEAQWGADTVRPMRDAIEAARQEVQAAFALRRQVDDAEAEPASQRSTMLEEIRTRSARARDLIEAELTRLGELRDLEHTAPALLEALGPRVDEAAARSKAAEAALAGLRETYGPSAVEPVRGNLVEATKALDGVRAEIARGRAAAVRATPARRPRHCAAARMGSWPPSV